MICDWVWYNMRKQNRQMKMSLIAIAVAFVAGGSIADAAPILEHARILDAGENLSFYIYNHDQSPVHRVIHPIVGKTNFVYDAKGALEKVPGVREATASHQAGTARVVLDGEVSDEALTQAVEAIGYIVDKVE